MATIEDKGQLFDAVPEGGEMPYEELYNQLRSTGQGDLLQVFHDMRRKGELVARLETIAGQARLFVSRGPQRPGTVG